MPCTNSKTLFPLVNNVPSNSNSFLSLLNVIAPFYHHSIIMMPMVAVLMCSKLAWMNMGYKQREASPLADLLAFRKVVNLNPTIW